MPTWTDIEDIVDIDMMLAGPPGTGITSVEKTTIDTRLTTQENNGLEDHPNVTITGTIDAGQVLVADGAGGWDNAAIPNGIDIANATVLITDNAGYLDFSEWFDVTDNGDGGAAVFPKVGTTAATLAAGNTVPTLPSKTRYDLASPEAVPVISSGRRQLISQSVGTFGVGVPTLVEVEGYLVAYGSADPAQFDLYITIDGSESNSAGVPRVEPLVAEWGVNGQWAWQAATTITRASGDAASRTVSFGVDWRGGSGVKVVSAWLWIKRSPYGS